MSQIAPNILIQDNLLTIEGETIDCFDVRAILFCSEPIQVDFYSIGNKYTVGFVTEQTHLIATLRTWFGINKKKQRARYELLVNSVWKSVVVRLYHELVDLIEEGNSAPVGPCTITPDGIIYTDFLIGWDDLSFQVNYNKLTLSSKTNSKIWTNLFYSEVYNVYPLRYFLERKFSSAVS